MGTFLIDDLTIYNLRFKCTRFMIEEGVCVEAHDRWRDA